MFGSDKFETGDRFDSLTKQPQANSVLKNSRKITLIDTPDLRDLRMEDVSIGKRMMSEHPQISSGFHCIAFVLNYNERFSKNEYDIFCDVKDLLGEDVTNNMILVFTHCHDSGVQDILDMNTNMDTNLERIIKSIENRVCGIESNSKVSELSPMIDKFLDIADELSIKEPLKPKLLKLWN